MAAILGATYPDLYTAVGVHSGLAPGSAHDMPSAFTAMRQGGPVVASQNGTGGGSRKIVPTIIFHGDGDTTVHPRNGERLLANLEAEDRNGSSLRVGHPAGRGTRRSRVRQVHLQGRGRPGSRGAVERTRARSRLVRRELPRLLHGP